MRCVACLSAVRHRSSVGGSARSLGFLMSVVISFDALVDTLTNVTPECEVLIATGRALAWEIDTAAMDNDDPKVKPRSAAAPANALRALVSDLLAKGRASGNSNEGEDDEDWSAPTAVTDLAEVRNAKEPGASNARSRSGGGRKSAS